MLQVSAYEIKIEPTENPVQDLDKNKQIQQEMKD